MKLLIMQSSVSSRHVLPLPPPKYDKVAVEHTNSPADFLPTGCISGLVL
jgi:hypothetical protein